MEMKVTAYLLVCIYSVVTCFVLFCLFYETHHDVSQGYPSSRRFTINGVIKVEKLNEGGDGGSDVVLIPEDGFDGAVIPEEGVKGVGAWESSGEADESEGGIPDAGGAGAGGARKEGREDQVMPHGEGVDNVSRVEVGTQSGHNITSSSTANLSSTGYFILDTKQPFTKRCRRCALVSSGGHLYRSRAGAEIDIADCVLRMNTAPVTGYSSDVGLRTDIRIIGHRNIPRGLVKKSWLRNEILSNSTTRTRYVVVPWLNKEKVNMKTNNIFKIARQFKHKYPEVDFVFQTNQKYSQSEAMFKKETGYSRAAMRTQFSTGFVSMIFALDVCDEVLVYGISRDDFCKKNPKAKVPYHYYQPKQKSECFYVKKSEMNSHTGHKFLTEHAMFARWSTVRNITFRFPSWNSSDASGHVGSYFLKKYKNTLGKHTDKKTLKRRKG